MADTPESLVNRGVEGTGAAQIFGREGNPMGAYFMRKNDVERKKAIQAEQARLNREKRDKKMWDLINVNPEKAFQPFNQHVINAADNHRKKIVDYFEKGGNPEDANFQRMAKKGWDEVNDIAQKSNYIKGVIDETQKVIKENPYLKAEHYYPKIWDLYMDEKGNGKSLDEIDPVAIQNIYVDDPSGFDANKYTKDFLGNLKANVFNYVKQKTVNSGILTEDIESKIQGDLYKPDPNTVSGVMEDEDGNPIINITPNFRNSFISNETAQRYFDSEAKKQGVPIQSVIEQHVRPQGGYEKNVKPSFSREPNWMYDYMNAHKSGLKPNQVPMATRRVENISSLINAFIGDEGKSDKPTPQAQAALGYLASNARFGDGHIVGATLVPGTNTPGTSEPLPGTVVTNSPNDRLILRVKYSDRGLPKAEEINLSDESAFAKLNSVFQTAKAEGEDADFGVDQLLALKNIDPSAIYKGREGMAKNNEAQKEAENQTIASWQQGNDMETLTGRYFGGKKIESARKVVSDPGIMGFGKKYEIELEFTNSEGNKEYKNIPSDNYDELAKIYRGEGVKKDDQMLNVIAPNGQRGRLTKEAYEKALKDGVEFKIVK